MPRAGRPALLTVECYRFYGHARMDKRPYRDSAEEEAGRRRDPLRQARRRLQERGHSGEDLDALDAAVEAEMDAAWRARSPPRRRRPRRCSSTSSPRAGRGPRRRRRAWILFFGGD